MPATLRRHPAPASPAPRLWYEQDLARLVKLADDGNDTSFEQAFSNIVHGYIRDKAPRLLDYELGFQMLDRSDDGKKATGVTAFKIGDQYAYVPNFFIRGQLKGQQLLYLKNQDLFAPLDEEWINKVTNQRTPELGVGVNRDTKRLGVRQPDMSRLINSPHKFASEIIPSVRPFLPVWADLLLPDRLPADIAAMDQALTKMSLDEFTKRASHKQLRVLSTMLVRHPKIAAAYAKWYDIDTLRQRLKEAAVREQFPNIFDRPAAVLSNRLAPIDILGDDGEEQRKLAEARQRVRVYHYQAGQHPEGLNDAERLQLMRDGIKVVDKRAAEETSNVYRTEVSERLFNPSATGLYEVLTKPGDFVKCLVAITGVSPGDNRVLCVNLEDDEHPFCWIPSNRVWCTKQYEKSDWTKWLESLPKMALEADNGFDNPNHVLVGYRGECLPPMQSDGELGGTFTSYRVNFDLPHGGCLCLGYEKRDGAPIDGSGVVRAFPGGYKPMDSAPILHVTKEGTGLRIVGEEIYVPESFRMLRVSNYSRSGWIAENMATAHLMLAKAASAMEITKSAAGLYHLNDSKGGRRNQLLTHLIVRHGLCEKAARTLLDEVDKTRSTKFLVKHALPFLTDGGPYAPDFPEQTYSGGGPLDFPGAVEPSFGARARVDDMAATNSDQQDRFNLDPHDPDILKVQDAANRGQKEVFDTATIGAILRATRADEASTEDIPDMIKGMNAVGKTLARFYAHGEQFAERYGKQDMPEFEDSLINTHKNLGDLVIFMQEKTVDPFPSMTLRDLDLTDAGGDE